MDKPTKPTNLMPRTFGGLKENYSTSLQQTGVEPNVPVIYHGKNFNYEKNAIGQELDYCEKIVDFINGIPIGKTITVDSNNKLQYADLAQEVPIATTETAGIVKPDGETITVDENGVISAEGGATRNIGEIIPSTIPLTDAGLHLLDGALISGSGSYSAFVDYMTKFTTIIPTNIAADNLQGFTVSATAAPTEVYLMFNNATYPRWQFNTNAYESPQSFTVIFPTSKDLSSYTVENYADSNLVSRIVTAWTLEYTKDGGTTWTQCDTRSGILQIEGLVTTCQLSSTIENINGIRFTATAGGDGGYSSVGQVRFYQTKATDLFIEEAQWQSAVATYGVCGKFVYDSVNNTVRLPKITGIVEGTTDLTALGDLVQAGLPNITGYTTADVGDSSGAFYQNGTPAYGNLEYHGDHQKLGFDASRSSSIYGNSTTVQPQAIKVLYYIVVATSTKTSIEVDIDDVVTDLNGKADVDLSNTTPSQSFINMSINWRMPDLTAGVTLANNSTIPSDGYIYIGILNINQNETLQAWIDNVEIFRWQENDGFAQGGSFWCPALKDGVFTCSNTNKITTRIFYPAKGAN